MLPPEEDRLELALSASNEGIWKWTVGEVQMEYSDRVLGFMGYDLESAPNVFTEYDRCFHENDRAHFQQVLEGVLKKDGRELFGVDLRFLRGDGNVCWLRIRGACVRQDGEAALMAGSMIDISRRKEAELALEEERHLLRMLIENIPNNVYFKDEESRFVMVNQATADKMGLESGADLIGRTDHDFFLDEHADKSRDDELEIMETKASQLQTLERETWDGRDDSWVITTKIPWYDRKGEVRGTFGVTSDVSPLVNTQKRLVDAAEQLRVRNETYREELQLAREIQAAVLEDVIEPLDGGGDAGGYDVRFATKYIPASEMAGDFYEVIPISKNKVGLLICDVMGHGVRAALVVSMLRGLIEREQLSASSPEWFLYGLNDGLAKILNRAGITMFATALYVVIDAVEGVVSYASAGHPMPLVMKDGGCEILSKSGVLKGPALGLMPESPYAGSEIAMNDFDRMLLFTDGVFEAENLEGEEYGEDGVCKLLESFEGEMSVGEVVDELTERVAAYCGGGKFGDDVCILGIEVSR